MPTRYYRNRIPREQPHGHHCNDCGRDWDCAKDPCYSPPNAPFSFCDDCIERSAALALEHMRGIEEATL